MCGINGFLYFKNGISETDAIVKIKKMNDTISHRGPDSDGVYVKQNVTLGFRRLSIIDLSSTANQPMLNGDETIAIVFNGEIYNYIELYQELTEKGYLFKTSNLPNFYWINFCKYW